MNRIKNICYFGIFDPSSSRNVVYIRGLKEHGFNIILCNSVISGPLKYLNLIKKFMSIRKDIDVIIVGYSGHIIVPLAKILSSLTIGKPVIFDALCSFYESNILSRDAFKNIPLRKLWCHLIDSIANLSADLILLETYAQKKYYVDNLGVVGDKCLVVYTGVDDSVFCEDSTIKKLNTFTAVFRGKINNESGVVHIIEAAEKLISYNINIRIIGFGWGAVAQEVHERIKKYPHKNLEFINSFLEEGELRKKTLECHVSLGQFACHERLSRTIPHKAFEALSMGIPYVTARSTALEEIFIDGDNCFMLRCGDADGIAHVIKEMSNRDMSEISHKMREEYKKKYTAVKIVEPLVAYIHKLHDHN